jgi:hypothetical protein
MTDRNENRTTIYAKELIQPDRPIVDNAEILAAEAIGKLQTGKSIRVSLIGVRSISSSYFNVILRRILDALGKEEFHQRVTFEFDSTVQQMAYDRSLAALSRAA